MRYPEGHKEETRQRVLQTAARRFRAEGIDQVGVASLMKDAGLTHGGFYSHFKSKEELVAEAVDGAMEESFRRLTRIAEEKGLHGLVDYYLSLKHLENPQAGCPAATLTGEMRRHSAKAREAFTRSFERMSAIIEGCLPDPLPGLAHSIFALLAGTLQFARAVNDRELTLRLLEEGKENVFRLAGLV